MSQFGAVNAIAGRLRRRDVVALDPGQLIREYPEDLIPDYRNGSAGDKVYAPTLPRYDLHLSLSD